MIRVLKTLPIVLIFMFSMACFAEDQTASQEGPPPPEGCDPATKEKTGEIVIDVEKLKELEHQPHPWTCLYLDRQNSILWQTKTFKSFTVTLKPLEQGDDPEPFNKPKEDFVSVTPKGLEKKVNGVLSSGPPKKGLPDKWLKYKVTIKYIDQEGQEHVIDPHMGIHG